MIKAIRLCRIELYVQLAPRYIVPYDPGMSHPQVVNVGTASIMECSHEYIE